MKQTFSYRTEWSDRSEHSPSTTGQLPEVVELPSGERVSLEPDEGYERASRAGYVQVHPEVRLRYSHWGDDGTRSMGRAGGKVEILAPKGSRVLFITRCPLCGNARGYVSAEALDKNGRAPADWHADCAKRYHEMQEGDR